MEERYQGCWNTIMMAAYCWIIFNEAVKNQQFRQCCFLFFIITILKNCVSVVAIICTISNMFRYLMHTFNFYGRTSQNIAKYEYFVALKLNVLEKPIEFSMSKL